MDQTHRVAMLVYPHAQLLDVAGPLEVFARTARWLTEHRGLATPAYTVELVGLAPGPLAMSSGLEVMVRRRYSELERVDTLLVTGGIGYASACDDPELLAWLRAQSETTGRIGSICTGALVLAAAGLLDGREATTHWAYCDRLAAMVPGCRVDPDAIFVRSGGLYTSAGVTTGMDLALALVEEDWGKAVALAVAQELVVYRKRPGGQGQFSRFLEAERRNDRFGELQLWVLDRLDQDLSVDRMAEVVGMSPRHFSRQFRAQVGRTPAAWLADLRLEEARRRIESGGFQLKDVARQCGFADEQNLRRTFQRRLGVAPRAYRERFGG